MSDFNELYQQVILEHNKKPRNFEVLEGAKLYALGKNPLCGDQFAVYVNVGEDGTIEKVAFQGSGCAIAKASASMMTTALKGKTLEEAHAMKDAFHKMLLGDLNPETDPHPLGRLTIFSGVKEYPVRVKCATLAWHTLDAAIQGQAETTTE
jgi:nitrogen fixation NifU-like protein